MGQRLSPEHQELYCRVDEVLHYLWDPIGVSHVPEARDEYQSYLPHIFSLLIHRGDAEEIAEFLTKTATQAMGLADTNSGREHSKQIAAILGHWRDVIRERHTPNA